jgi:hypothetical protein
MNFEKYRNYMKEKLEEVKIDSRTQVGKAYNDGIETMYHYAMAMLSIAETDHFMERVEQIDKKVIA